MTKVDSTLTQDAASHPRYTFVKSPVLLTKVVIALLGLMMVWNAVTCISSVSDWWHPPPRPQQLQIGVTLHSSTARPQGVSDFVGAVFSLTTAICYFRWVYLANVNCRGFGAEMTYTPGWSVAYYLIPIVGLFRPYQAMREVWNASEDPTRATNSPGSPLLKWWWAWCVIGFPLEYFVADWGYLTDANYGLRITPLVVAIVRAIDVVAVLLTILVVAKICAMQVRLTETGRLADDGQEATKS